MPVCSSKVVPDGRLQKRKGRLMSSCLPWCSSMQSCRGLASLRLAWAFSRTVCSGCIGATSTLHFLPVHVAALKGQHRMLFDLFVKASRGFSHYPHDQCMQVCVGFLHQTEGLPADATRTDGISATPNKGGMTFTLVPPSGASILRSWSARDHFQQDASRTSISRVLSQVLLQPVSAAPLQGGQTSIPPTSVGTFIHQSEVLLSQSAVSQRTLEESGAHTALVQAPKPG